MVYIREAHAIDGRRPPRRGGGIRIREHKTAAERQSAASSCAAGLKLEMPVAFGSLDNHADRCFGARPNRLAVVGAGGTLIYHGGRGPWGFKPAEAEAALRRAIAERARAQQADALDEALR